MTRYSNFIKATSLTTSLSPNTAETLYKIIDSNSGLNKLTGAQCAAVAALMFHQYVVGLDDGLEDGQKLFY